MTVVPNTQRLRFNKTETEYNMKSIRFLLLTITTMFIIIASLMIVIGISVYSHYHNFSYFYESAKSGFFFTPSIMMVVLGIVILIVTSFGFYGSLKKSTFMVNLYAFILTLILIVKLVVVILSFTMYSDTMLDYINIPVWEYIHDPEIAEEIDTLQVSLNCCGSSSFLDYAGLEFTTNHSTVVHSTEVEGDLVSVVVPSTCCLQALDGMCTRMRPDGCKYSLVDLIVQYAGVLGVLGVSVMFIQLLGIIFALMLARCIRKAKSERALMMWKIKEQQILTRMATEHKAQVDASGIYIDPRESSVA